MGRDRFAQENKIRLQAVHPGYARTEMTIEDRHLNGLGIVQGGAIFTLADLAFAAAANSGGSVAVSCQADIRWFRAVRSGSLIAEAEEVCRTRRLSSCIVRVTDEGGTLVALLTGTAYIREQVESGAPGGTT